ncbi:hypothetical protein N7467_001687 [Penicillium canescens]|nr:hypothetical protein N7467_001687 [Penicillium canescens]
MWDNTESPTPQDLVTSRNVYVPQISHLWGDAGGFIRKLFFEPDTPVPVNPFLKTFMLGVYFMQS